ncbi:uncharacterized protein RAG0_03101 [Rhynchosporium agropyri]|uniref:GTP cyclohydrolase 1 n=1 Tax=Rhynchosporium agropyri TaxID=914238 RepID=A0A1E1K317_9HELO|nr:uncharacterized protein RAG0_03101 [Rhynchosporium agropyri]
MENMIYGKEDQKLAGATDGEGYNGSDISPSSLGTSFVQSLDTQHPKIDVDGLSWPTATKEEKQEHLVKISSAIRIILECGGENPDREGLRDTPERFAKAFLFFTKGYGESLHTILNDAIFHEDY